MGMSTARSLRKEICHLLYRPETRSMQEPGENMARLPFSGLDGRSLVERACLLSCIPGKKEFPHNSTT